MAPLLSRGITGRGRTIAIVDAFGSPTIAHDLQVFDQAFGLAAPPSLTVIAPAGAIPRFDPANPAHTDWAGETTLDVEYAHAMAPEANILIVETPISETEGLTGFPEIVKAENYVLDHNLADVLSQSFGATEQTFPSTASLLSLRTALLNAERRQVTVLASSGDSGATDYQLDGNTRYPRPVNSWPSTDPLVTSIGGTALSLDATGNRTAPDLVWNDLYGSGGGGLSSVFARPSFQRGVAAVVGTRRGTPDISMSAAVNGAAVIYSSYDAADTGWSLVGGTSEAAPIFAGVIALADQIAHRRLGSINQALYTMGQGGSTGIVDVKTGNNSYSGVTGYRAGAGYDLASGWGTVDVAEFVPQLAFVASHPSRR
jgi:subtilase family serine protease